MAPNFAVLCTQKKPRRDGKVSDTCASYLLTENWTEVILNKQLCSTLSASVTQAYAYSWIPVDTLRESSQHQICLMVSKGV